MTDQNVIGSLRWDLSFFDGIGGASEALRRINNNVLLTLNWDMDTDCTQFVTQKFSSVPMGDVAKSDIEQVAQRIDVAVQGRQYVMVITAGPPCPDFSRIRETPKGTDGNSGWLFQHMLEVEHQLRKRFRDIPIETVFENVVPRPSVRENLLELTTPLAMAPIVLDASDSGLMHRKRLWWTTIPWDRIEEKLPRLTPWSLTWSIDDGWNSLQNPVAADLQQPIITDGYSLPHCLQNDNKLFHCLTTPATSMDGRTQPRQIGSGTTSPEAWNRWEQDHRRYPPWQYESQFLVTLPDGSMSTAPAGLREQLQGLPLHYTSTLDSGDETKRSVALGNAWHLPTAIWMLFLPAPGCGRCYDPDTTSNVGTSTHHYVLATTSSTLWTSTSRILPRLHASVLLDRTPRLGPFEGNTPVPESSRPYYPCHTPTRTSRWRSASNKPAAMATQRSAAEKIGGGADTTPPAPCATNPFTIHRTTSLR